VKNSSPVVDMRSRPPFLHPFFGGGSPGTPEYEVVRWLNKRVGAKNVDHFARGRTVDDYMADMDDSGIMVAVMVARSVPGVRVTNAALAQVAQHAPDRLIGIGSVDPIELGYSGALEQGRQAIRELGLRGLNFDAGFYKTPLKADDRLLMPLYQLCDDLSVPAFIMSGPTTPDLSFNDPLAVDNVAKTFPKLKIICCHGFYPNVQGMIQVAFRNENVFVSPDMYTFLPHGDLYIQAANHFMKDQFLFGSSYPFRPMKQGVEDFCALGLSPEALDAALYRNASRVFGLDLESKSELQKRKAG
jgi:uncharacterized protein